MSDEVSLKSERTERSFAAGGAPKSLIVLLIVGGLIGFIAAFDLTVEKIELLMDPNYIPSCSISPLLSCGGVMKTAQATAFGFPNSLLGIAGFSIVTTVGAALAAGATFRRWFWLGLQAGVTLGVLFVLWLIFSSLFVIGLLCPYCLVVWAVTIPIFWYVTTHNLREGHIATPHLLQPITDSLVRRPLIVVIAWMLLIVVLILIRFWDYWSTLI